MKHSSKAMDGAVSSGDTADPHFNLVKWIGRTEPAKKVWHLCQQKTAYFFHGFI